jgi:uncharacterized protein with NRDE domain
VCLIIAAAGVDPTAPLVVAANRDERLERPAQVMTVLRAGSPRILGGRDERAGGTWLAVNEHGVVAALTNRPSPGGPDPSKRSRGELPLALAHHADAATALEAVLGSVDAADYNPAWLLVGDRTSLFFAALAGEDGVVWRSLGPGVHILENRAIDVASPKAAHVRGVVGNVVGLEGDGLTARLAGALQDHVVPAPEAVGGEPTVEPGRGAIERDPRADAACVHLDGFGTRCATLVRVPWDGGGPPEVRASDGPPCTAPFVDFSGSWRPSAPARGGAAVPVVE